MAPDIAAFQTDHLFLLIGANPLPNLVAARLLAHRDSHVWLLYSDGSSGDPSTHAAAVCLKRALTKDRQDDHVHLEPIPSSDNAVIEDRVRCIVNGKNVQGSIGLNYTSGTKPMAVHTYRVLEQKSAEDGDRIVFSYLDPRNLALRIDRQGATPRKFFQILKDPALRAMTSLTLDELADLHGYEPDATAGVIEWATCDTYPELEGLCTVLMKIHACKEAFGEYRTWVKEKVFETLPDEIKYPRLKDLRAKLIELGGGADAAALHRFAVKMRPQDPAATLGSCRKWFLSGWLEEYGALTLKRAAAQLSLRSSRNRQFRPRADAPGDKKGDKFELDLAVLSCYQLFAISCIATVNKDPAKEHLFEIFVRARQLGGDEARIGLVTCLDAGERQQLNEEIARDWDARGKVRIFGRDDLKGLEEALQVWIQTAN